MSYLDFTDDIIAIDQSKGITPTTMQPLPTPLSTSAVVQRHHHQQQQQQAKDLSDWRNIQLGASSTLFDPFWLPQTPVTPLSSPWAASNNTLYPSPYNQLSSSSQHLYPSTNPNNNNQPWKIPAFPIEKTQSFGHFNHPILVNNVTDMPTNATVNPSTPIRNFIPVQPPPYPYPTPPIIPLISKHRPKPSRETELILIPDLDIDEILGEVQSVIPDIDLDAARQTIVSMNPIPSTNDIVTHFLDNGYTKRVKKSHSTNSERQSSLKRSISDMIDDIPKFLSSYPDPVNYFFDTKRKQSESYTNHAKAFLIRAFPTTDKTILEQALQEENCHFLPTVRKLETRAGIRTNSFLQRMTIKRSLDMIDLSIDGVGRKPSIAWIIKNNKFAYPIPHIPCEEFYDELRFAKNEVKIRRYLGKVSKEHEKRVKKAKKGNETLECEICCQEDLLIDDMVECTVGHLYCRNCVRTHIDICFKEGKCSFACVENSCPGEYTMRLVSELLPPKDLKRLNRRIQEENIRQAAIDGLECCPYCPYAVIVDNPDDKIFRCLNPECMKETCRLCKEPNHIPLRCDEVEKGIELEMRKFIEEHVTEAMIRKCPRCTQRFYKVEGCNKMTCSSCGLFICYVCRETINGYDHFTNNERCTLSNQSEKIHYEEMVQAYQNAKNEYRRLHPEAHDMILRYDPISHLLKPPTSTTGAT
ncbi:unnamed protein product [Rotaria socialis]|uniref:RING-type domain-containing protein n=2 Tax=Bdelloidea TaxID=44578 RepID=A0A821DL48_9BILA|nr:unnamed protein product [Rotaria socialis]CAF3334782.1 unnamed protein product [Rotaria socialis]CAF3435694.1 unnamed protein product [Rotaria socialis]CAF3446050.1 unnamed protein product [Rotaria socialis]CAF3522200.1 unnamed protein product [Rotaria socialis]